MSTTSTTPPVTAANEICRLPPKIFNARCATCWFMLALAALIAASFWTLDLQWAKFLSLDAARRVGRFLGELLSPATHTAFLWKLAAASLETIAMSMLGTLLAAIAGLALALPASRTHAADLARWRTPTRLALNSLRSIPELVWAALLIIAAGLGPLAGTLALALHTTGVLGRLFAEAIENAPPGPAFALRVQGVPASQVFLYATLVQILPQLLSYTLYRWENNIRAAAILGVVGGGGLGALLTFHLGLFHMNETSAVLIAMMLLVALVDLTSHLSRRLLQR